MNKKDKSHFIENISGNAKTPREPFVKHNSKPNVEYSTPNYGKSWAETTKATMNIPMNDLLVESNEVMSKIPQNKEAGMYSKRDEENNEDNENPLVDLFNKIVYEKVSPKPTLALLEGLSRSLIDKAKGKEKKVGTPKPTKNIVKKKILGQASEKE